MADISESLVESWKRIGSAVVCILSGFSILPVSGKYRPLIL